MRFAFGFLQPLRGEGIAPATRCLQGSVATPAHAPPFQLSEARVRKSVTCLPVSDRKLWHIASVLPRASLVLDCGGAKRSLKGGANLQNRQGRLFRRTLLVCDVLVVWFGNARAEIGSSLEMPDA
jgi:hypothetical protein